MIFQSSHKFLVYLACIGEKKSLLQPVCISLHFVLELRLAENIASAQHIVQEAFDGLQSTHMKVSKA